MGATKLADFGIAKAAEQTRITQVGSVLGTAAYLSPEQARGEEAGPPSDIYSLGVCAYQFLTGRLPHEYASLTELALKQQQDPVDADHRLPARGAAGAGRGGARRARARPGGALRARALEMAEAHRGRHARRGHRGHAAARHERPRHDRRRSTDDRRHAGAPAHDRGPEPHARARTPSRRPRAEARAPTRRAGRRPARGQPAPLGHASSRCWPSSRRSRSWRSRCCRRRATASVDPVQQPDVQQQIDGLRDFIQAHTR